MNVENKIEMYVHTFNLNHHLRIIKLFSIIYKRSECNLLFICSFNFSLLFKRRTVELHAAKALIFKSIPSKQRKFRNSELNIGEIKGEYLN